MDQALALARNGLYTTMPNPRVGCVLVNKGLVVGQGWHERTGEAHAEIRALQDAGTKARGATAYVTLEPCSHMGRTPPCADALIKAGVVHVVVAMQDPNPKVAGAGIARLRAAGITVEVGIGAEEARELNIGFVSRMTRGQPWVRSKVAMSLDGRTALGNGVSQWITGTEARADGHHWRARSCAMLTGAGTVRQDDPALTVRHVKSSRQPLRIVVDNKCEAPLDAQVFADGNALLVTVSADAARIQEYEARGVEVLVTKPGKTGRVGGHLVSGHVDGVGTVLVFEPRGESWFLRLQAPADCPRYIARKGSITVNGISLTVNEVSGSTCEINIIPHTRAVTTFAALQAGDPVNLEVDLLARYAERAREWDAQANLG